MGACCEIKAAKRRVLWLVLGINALLFVVQFSAALIANSSALLADSCDMLGDVLAYAISLFALSRGGSWLSRAAFIKGTIIGFFACVVLFDVLTKLIHQATLPSATLMLIFSLLGLIGNGLCLWLLTHYRESDINMRSVWLCARNDIVGNLSVIVCAIAVYWFHSDWPDLIIGLGLAIFLLHSAFTVLRAARQSQITNKA